MAHKSKQNISYEVIPASKTEEISDFLVKNFFPNEPISRGFGLPISQVTRWFPLQVRECLKPEICVSAIDATTGELVGVAVNIIAEKWLKTESTSASGEEKEGRGLLDILDPVKEPVMVEIAKFLGILNQVPDSVYGPEATAQPQPLQTFNCVYLAVLPSYSGLGIGQRLVEESEKIAKEKNITLLQVDTTSEFSFKIFQKCGYNVVREISLDKYISGMEKVDDGAHKKGRILIKKI